MSSSGSSLNDAEAGCALYLVYSDETQGYTVNRQDGRELTAINLHHSVIWSVNIEGQRLWYETPPQIDLSLHGVKGTDYDEMSRVEATIFSDPTLIEMTTRQGVTALQADFRRRTNCRVLSVDKYITSGLNA